MRATPPELNCCHHSIDPKQQLQLSSLDTTASGVEFFCAPLASPRKSKHPKRLKVNSTSHTTRKNSVVGSFARAGASQRGDNPMLGNVAESQRLTLRVGQNTYDVRPSLGRTTGSNNRNQLFEFVDRLNFLFALFNSNAAI